MRKKLGVLLCLVMVLMSGCVSQEYKLLEATSDEMLEIGQDCLEDTQSYIDGKMSYDTYCSKILDYRTDSQDIVDDHTLDESKQYTNDEKILDCIYELCNDAIYGEEGDIYSVERDVKDLEEIVVVR